MPSNNDLVRLARTAAEAAGRYLLGAQQPRDPATWAAKGNADWVTEVDRTSEEIISRTLLDAEPGSKIVGEELSPEIVTRGLVWIVDPLDGTTNYLHGFQQYCVSVALVHKGVITHGVVYDPCRNDLYTASRGRGAYLNDKRLRVSRREKLIDSLIGTGFPFRMFDHLDAYTGMLKDLMTKTAGVRRPGSAALDLANVAAGRLDGFWEIGLAPWDMAAGCLMITEAGGLVGDLEGNERFMHSGNLVAGSPKIFAQLLQVIQPHLTPMLRTQDK